MQKLVLPWLSRRGRLGCSTDGQVHRGLLKEMPEQELGACRNSRERGCVYSKKSQVATMKTKKDLK